MHASWFEERLGVTRPVVALSLARMADGIGNSILIVLIPIYIVKLPHPALPDSILVGIMIALFGLVNTASQPFAGAWSDRLGRRKIFIQAGLLLMGLATLGFVVAGSFTSLVIVRCLQGVGFALTVTASVALLTEVTERHTRGAAMGVFTTFRMVGFAIGPLLGGWLNVAFGFDTAFWVGAAFILGAMVFVQAWVRDPEAHPAQARGTRLFDTRLLTPGVVGLGFAMFVMAADIAMMSTLENGFNERLDQTALGFGMAFSALTVSRLVFQVPLGAWSDRIGRKPLVMAGLALLAPTTAVLGLAGSTLQLTGIRLVQGVASAGIAAPALALAGDLSTEGGAGRQLSVLTMGFALGIAGGPLMAGFLAVHSFELPFLVGAALALVAVAVVWRRVSEPRDDGAHAVPSCEEAEIVG